MVRLVLAVLAACFIAGPVTAAACSGRDLIADMADADRAELTRSAEAVPYARGNFWRAVRDDQVIHLVGTYHFDDPRHDAAMTHITPVLEGARTVLVEAGPEEETRLADELGHRPDFMFLTEGPTLPEMLPEEDWRALADAMRARAVPPFLAAKFRPWYMAMLLSLPPCAMSEMQKGAKGLDHRVIAAAEARGIPVRALEPYDTLFRIFGVLTMEQELDMIRTSLLMADRAEDYTTTLANAYFRGESRLIWEFTLAEARAIPGYTPEQIEEQFGLMEEVLMTLRNRAWIPVLLDAAQQGEVLAAFGALHLPGEAGVLALLEAEGFAISPF